MTARIKTPLDNFIRGSEVWHHKLAMLLKSVGWILLCSVSAGVSSISLWIFVFFTSTDRTIFFYNRVSYLETMIGLGRAGLLSMKLDVQGVDSVRLLPVDMLQATQPLFHKIFGYTLEGGVFFALLMMSIVATKMVRF